MNIVTEIRDRLFDNQRDLDQCIDNFRMKISSLVSDNIGDKNDNDSNEKEKENNEQA